jgi:hypothetical protein
MIHYIVHLYREMRLSYTGIEADTPQAAAAIAGGKPTGDADNIEDCDGQDLAALVDVAGDEDYSQSVTIDFEPERIRKAAATLLAALTYALEYLKANNDGEQDVSSRIAAADAAIAEANATGISPAPRDVDIHGLLAERRQIAHIWDIEDVQEVRPDLSADQCWQVLQQVDDQKDAGLGITWLTLEMAAEDLFGDAPENDEADA